MPTSSNGTYTLDTKVLDALIKNLDGNVAEAVAKAAFALEGRAKLRAPVDTGALRASIYTSLKGRSKFSDARAEAIGRGGRRNGSGKVEPLTNANFVELPKPNSDTVAHVGPSVEYGADVELGTARRSGTPYLQPAMRETEKDIRELLSKAVTNGK